MRLTTVSTLAIAFLYSAVAIGQTDVPNTFQAGQPARAAEVNANFSTLETAANNNAASITSNTAAIGTNSADISASSADIQANTLAISAVAAITVPRVKANDQDIGSFLNTTVASQFFFASFWVLSDKNYMFEVAARETNASSSSTGIPGEIQWQMLRFTTPNCSGQAYVGIDVPGDGSLALFRSGVVFPSYELSDPLVYYSPRGSTPISGLLIQSRSTPGGCSAEGNTAIDLIAVFPNDPLITGVPNQRNFDPPITLGVQTYLVPVPPPPPPP